MFVQNPPSSMAVFFQNPTPPFGTVVINILNIINDSMLIDACYDTYSDINQEHLKLKTCNNKIYFMLFYFVETADFELEVLNSTKRWQHLLGYML